MKKTPFEDYLKERHAESYNGTDDNMPDAFDNWLTNLQADDWIDLGEEFALALTKDPHIKAGLVPAGINDEGEEEWIGDDKAWDAYEKLTQNNGN